MVDSRQWRSSLLPPFNMTPSSPLKTNFAAPLQQHNIFFSPGFIKLHPTEADSSVSTTVHHSHLCMQTNSIPGIAMNHGVVLVLLCLLCGFCTPSLGYFAEERWSPESPLLAPRVVLALICRNSEQSLPYVLGSVERLDYPKERIAVWWERNPPTSIKCWQFSPNINIFKSACFGGRYDVHERL